MEPTEVEYRLPSVPIQFYENGLFDASWVKTDLINIHKFTSGPICLEMLRSIGAHGRINVWQAGFDGVQFLYLRSGSYKIISLPGGQKLEGTVETVRTPVLENSTSRTIYENAIIKIKHRFIVQMRKGFATDINEMQNAKSDLCMLATIYRDGSQKVSENKKNTKKGSVVTNLKAGLTWYLTAKLRGVRMIIRFFGEGGDLKVECKSRGGKLFNHLAAIKRSLLLLAPYLPAGFRPDGEAYIHGWKQQRIATVVNVTATEAHPDESKVMFYLFDGVSQLPYDQRHAILDAALTQCKKDNPEVTNIFLIPYVVLNDSNISQLKAYRDHYISQGFEGVVIRLGGQPYINGRSVKMYKYKAREDDEGKIIGVDEWPKRPGSGLPRFNVKYKGTTVHVIMNEDEDYQRKLYRNRDKLIGKKITFELEKDGITVDGKFKEGRGIDIELEGVAIRDYE